MALPEAEPEIGPPYMGVKTVIFLFGFGPGSRVKLKLVLDAAKCKEALRSLIRRTECIEINELDTDSITGPNQKEQMF